MAAYTYAMRGAESASTSAATCFQGFTQTCTIKCAREPVSAHKRDATMGILLSSRSSLRYSGA